MISIFGERKGSLGSLPLCKDESLLVPWRQKICMNLRRNSLEKQTLLMLKMDALEESFCIMEYVELCRGTVARLNWECGLMYHICMLPHSWLLLGEQSYCPSCTALVIDWQLYHRVWKLRAKRNWFLMQRIILHVCIWDTDDPLWCKIAFLIVTVATWWWNICSSETQLSDGVN